MTPGSPGLGGYRLLDHTADFGLEIQAETPADLFRTAGLALTDLMTDRGSISPRHKARLHLQGEDWPDLMWQWLRELLSYWSIRRCLVADIAVADIRPGEIRARIQYDRFDPGVHELYREVKAVTYHQLTVVSGSGGWTARVFLDV